MWCLPVSLMCMKFVKLRPSPDQVKQLAIFRVNKSVHLTINCTNIYTHAIHTYIANGFLHSVHDDPIPSYARARHKRNMII